jgi:hypothetical protein
MSEMQKEAIGALGAGLAAFGLGAGISFPKLVDVAGKGGKYVLEKAVAALRPKPGIIGGTIEAFKKLPAGKQLADSEKMLLRMGLLGLAAGGAAGYKAIQAGKKIPQMRGLMSSMESDPEVSESDYGKAQQIYKVIQQYAPSLAANPSVSRSLVKQQLAISAGQSEIIGPSFIHQLVESEKKVRESGAGRLKALELASKAV